MVDSHNLDSRDYVKFTSDIEEIPPNEAEDIRAAAETINLMQKAQFTKHRHCYTGTHARTNGIVKGSFEVPNNLPPHLKQGELFSKGGVYPVVARYSTEPGDPSMDDRIAQPRGFSIKIFDIDGDRFDEGKDLPTHDFEFNSAPAIELADARTTREILNLRLQYGHDHDKLYKQLEQRADCPLQKARDQVYNTHLESITQYSQTAYRFGDYIMKYRLVPSSDVQKKLYDEPVKASHADGILQQWLQNFYEQFDAEYEFQVQLCEDLKDQPIEYAGVEWDSERFPFQTVAKIKFPKQNSFDYNRKTFWEDHMRLDPFLGLKSYQPIGSPNRLRRGVYPASSKLRRELNGRKEIHVKTIDEIP